MKKKKMLLTLLVFVSLSIALCGCIGDKSSADTSSITIGLPQDLEESLDPHVAKAAGTKEVLFNMFEGLVKPDSDGNFIPALASKYEILDEGKVYSFTLRKDVKFHDGSLVTAEDVIYSINRCADATDETTFVPAYSNIEKIEELETGEIQITLKEKDTEFLAYMTTAIIPKSNLNANTNPIGTGPYRFVSRSPQENIVLERFDSYWGEPANIKNVTLKILSNADMIVMNLNGGAINMYARLTTTQANEVSDQFKIYESTMNLVQALYLNNKVAPFNDLRVRQALCYAIDVDALQNMLFDGHGQEIGSSMFPSFGKYYKDDLKDYYTVDYKKAKELLNEAGYPDGFSFTITVPSNYQPHIDTAQVLVEQFKNIGVTCTISLVEWNTWLSEVYTNRNYEATVIGVDAPYLTARALLERFASDSSSNFINFQSEEYDKVLKNAIASVDEAKKIELYKTCEEILTKDAASVYIQDMPELVALNKRFAGFVSYPLYVLDIAKLYQVEN